MRVVGVDERWALTTLPVAAIEGKAGLLVRDARRAGAPDAAVWTDVRRIGTVVRPGVPGVDFSVYRVTAVGGSPTEVELPRR